jgi:hypothetical protein
VKESGRIFAVPTYAFVVAMALMIGYGLYKAGFGGGLDQISIEEMNPEQAHEAVGVSAVGWFLVLHAFASGGAAVTGVEAISNGVPAFREPSWKNAAQTLVVNTTFGTRLFGVSRRTAAGTSTNFSWTTSAGQRQSQVAVALIPSSVGPAVAKSVFPFFLG